MPVVDDQTLVANDNLACIQWEDSLMVQGEKYINLKENKIWEVLADKDITVLLSMGPQIAMKSLLKKSA